MRRTSTAALATVAAGIMLSALGLTQPATAATVTGTLNPGQQLVRGDSLVSPHGQHRLWLGPEIDTEGLVLDGCGEDVMATVPASSTDTRLVMQQDGNLVLYAGNVAYFQTGTYGNPGARAVLQDDRNLVVYSPTNKPLWNTGQTCNAVWNEDVLIGDPMTTDFRAGDYMMSVNRQYRLIMQQDGNLVLYKGARALWASNTRGQGNTATFEPNGVLRVKNASERQLWASPNGMPNRYPMPGAGLVMQDDGNLVIYRISDDGSQATPLWHTRTAGR